VKVPSRCIQRPSWHFQSISESEIIVLSSSALLPVKEALLMDEAKVCCRYSTEAVAAELLVKAT